MSTETKPRKTPPPPYAPHENMNIACCLSPFLLIMATGVFAWLTKDLAVMQEPMDPVLGLFLGAILITSPFWVAASADAITHQLNRRGHHHNDS